ncbi:bifunctional DNA primase/polymerase [Ruegeria sp. HKCCD7221]|uniref:bifunctional DNA primase/polymerase n=1 Tax=Ruegeria sp. HKCCD7221 TaxID=2683009 RepID=UPI0014876B6C|nr:bifunctional DNA primase/polymerase [Ruegeria sp. HKCCD7221]
MAQIDNPQEQSQANATDWKEAARKATGMRLSVFPILISAKPGGGHAKRPLTRNGHLNASLQVEDFDNWHEANGFGIAMGGDLFAFDLDRYKTQDGGVAAEQWLKDNGLDKPTRKHETISGGEHWIMKLPAGREDTPGGVEIVEGLDSRGDGGWIAFGEGYKLLDDSPLAEIPDTICQDLMDRWKVKNGGLGTGPLRDWKQPDNAEQVLVDLLARDAPLAKRWAGDVNGLDDLSASALQFSVARRLSLHEREILDRTGDATTYDFIAWALHDQFEHGTMYKDGGPRSCRRDAARVQKPEAAQEFDAIEMDDAKWAEQAKARAANGNRPLPDFDELEYDTTDDGFAHIAGLDCPAGGLSVGVFDPLKDVPGLVGSFARWGYDTAWRPDPAPALVGALTSVSLAVGMAFKFDRADDNYGNLYANIIMPSTSGKQDAVRMLKLASALTPYDVLWRRVRSQPALHNCFLDVKNAPIGPRGVLLFDELGRHLQNLKSGKNTTLAEVSDQMIITYSDYHIAGQKLATKPRPEVDEAYLVVLGDAQPKVLAKGLPADAVDDGSVARALWFFGDWHRKRANGPVNKNGTVLPKEVEDALTWLFDRKGMLPFVGTGHGVIDLALTPEAEAVMLAFDDECENAAAEANAEADDKARTIYSRAYQNSRRVALVIAAGEAAMTGDAALDMSDPDKPTIALTEVAANAAVAVTRQSVLDLIKYASEHIGITEEDKVELRVLRTLGKRRQDGQKVVKHKSLVDACRNSASSGSEPVSGDAVRKAIENLLDRGHIDKGSVDGGTATGYKLSSEGLTVLAKRKLK